MIKYFLPLSLALFTLFGSVNCSYAQTKEERDFLKSLQNEKEINVILDMSQVIIHGKTEADFVYIEDVSSDEDWSSLWINKYRPSLFRDLLGELNSSMFDYGYTVRFGNFQQAKYQIRLLVLSISEKGDTHIKVYYERAEEKQIIYSIVVYGHGGIFGSKVNLMGDGFKRAGVDLAKQTKRVFEWGR